MSSYMIVDSNECSNNSCSSSQGYFQIKNLFSELKTEVDKANARHNLGIGDAWNIKWGNITGYIERQTDLTQYLDNFIIVYKEEINQTIEELQSKLENKIQEQVDLLEEDRQEIERLINTIDQFKQELKNLINPYNQPYTNSDNPSITTVGEALDQLLYKELTIKSKVTPSIAERGEIIPEVEFSWEYNKNIISQKLDNIDISPDIRSITLSNIRQTISKSLWATDGKSTKTTTMAIQFKLASYYGVSNKTTITSDDIINSFTRDFNFQKGSSVTITAQDNQYIYFMLPKSMGQVQFYVGGFEGGFQVVDSNFQFTKNGATSRYILYRSDNPGLGTTTINTK